MLNKIKIRKATKKDVKVLFEIVKKEKAIENYPHEYSKKTFEKILLNKDSIVFVIPIASL